MSAEASTSRLAPSYPIASPLVELGAIEYPARVRNSNKAFATIGGLTKVSASLDSVQVKEAPTPSNTIEYNLNPLNPYSHPVPATLVHSGNVVLKVTKRRRKAPKLDREGNVVDQGLFVVQVEGVATKTVRFRGQSPPKACQGASGDPDGL